MIELPLIEALNDEDSLVRGGAAYALGDSKIIGAIEPITVLLKDENANVRRLAVFGLANMEDSLAVEPLISVVLLDPDSISKLVATSALLRLEDPRAVEIYISTLNSGDSWMEARAADILLDMDIPRVVEYHAQASMIMLYGKKEELQIKAAVALLNFKDSIPDDIRARALKVIITSLNSEEENMRMKAAKTLIHLKDTIPNDIRTLAQKIIDEETYIEAFILFDDYGRSKYASLDNIDGVRIASLTFEYHDFNGNLISRTITLEPTSTDTLRIIDYNDYGKPEKYKYLCLDKKGNIIKTNSKPVLTELFQFSQKESSKISYTDFGRVKLYKTIKIYPCQDCAKKTSVDNCIYVW